MPKGYGALVYWHQLGGKKKQEGLHAVDFQISPALLVQVLGVGFVEFLLVGRKPAAQHDKNTGLGETHGFRSVLATFAASTQF